MEKIGRCSDLDILKFLKTDFVARLWSILEIFLCALEKNKYTVKWNVLKNIKMVNFMLCVLYHI